MEVVDPDWSKSRGETRTYLDTRGKAPKVLGGGRGNEAEQSDNSEGKLHAFALTS